MIFVINSRTRRIFIDLLNGWVGFNQYQAPQLNVSEIDCSMRLNTIHIYHSHARTPAHSKIGFPTMVNVCVRV